MTKYDDLLSDYRELQSEYDEKCAELGVARKALAETIAYIDADDCSDPEYADLLAYWKSILTLHPEPTGRGQ